MPVQNMNEKHEEQFIDNSALDLLKRAIESENSQVQRPKTAAPISRDRIPESNTSLAESAVLPERKSMNLEEQSEKFNKTKVLSENAKRRIARAKELLKLIDLDVGIYTLFDMPPLNEYDLYIKNFGSLNSHQAATQTHEEYDSTDCQTEEIILDEKWVQCTPDATNEVGGGDEKSFGGDVNEMIRKRNALSLSSTFTRFIKRASKVVENLLEESEQSTGGSQMFQVNDKYASFSQGSSPIVIPRFLSGRKILVSRIRSLDRQCIIMSWARMQDSTPFSGKSIVLVTNYALATPSHKLLISESNVSALCSCESHPHLIFGGSEDGSILVWDMKNEDPTLVRSTTINDTEYRVFFPSYNTSGQYTLKNGHQDKIAFVKVLESNRNKAHGQVSLKMVSVDASGMIQNWIALVNSSDKVFTDYVTDFGMAINSRVKIIRNGSLSVASGRIGFEGLAVSTCSMPIQDSSVVILGSEAGLQKESRVNDRVYPRHFKSVSTSTPETIDFLPSAPDLFLVGYSDGKIGLYFLNDESPRSIWSFSDVPIVQISWSQHRAAVFFALDAQGRFGIFDLTENGNDAVFKQTVKDLQFFSLGPQSERKGTMAFTFSDGRVELHLLNNELYEHVVDEENTVRELRA